MIGIRKELEMESDRHLLIMIIVALLILGGSLIWGLAKFIAVVKWIFY
jgi:hypothetical protein